MKSYLAATMIVLSLAVSASALTRDDVLSVRDGQFHLDGRPFAEISFNKFDLLWQLYSQLDAGHALTADNPMVQAQDKALGELHALGFRTIRIFALPWKDIGNAAYADPDKRKRLYEALDKTVELCDRHDIRVVWSLGCGDFTDVRRAANGKWQYDGEHVRELISDPESEGRKRLYRYLDETVSRYKGRKTVLMWEIGNEITLHADIGKDHVFKNQRMPTLKDVARFYDDVAKRIKKADPLRLVNNGGSHMRECQWNLYTGKGWKKDTLEEQRKGFELLFGDTAVDVIDVHSYPNHKPAYEISDGKGGTAWIGPSQWMEIAKGIHKPLMIGEFGALPFAKSKEKIWQETPDYFERYADLEAAKPWVEKTLNDVIDAGVQLSYWWCYQSDRPMDQNNPQRFDITIDRNPELVALIADANKRLQEFRGKMKEWQAKGGWSHGPVPTPPVGPKSSRRPSGLYDCMIKPLQPYTIKGVIWYQGEGNSWRYKEFRTLFPAFIKGWRKTWENPDLPFYFVQLPPFKAEQWPHFRQAQLDCARAIPNCGMVVSEGCGDLEDVHPKVKKPIGLRLANAACVEQYGQPGPAYGPMQKSVERKGNKLIVSFDHVGSGLVCKGERLASFEIAGKDKVFVKADARIVGNRVEVSSQRVADPQSVRYAYAPFPVMDLFNNEGLPASPFTAKVTE